MSDRIAFQRSAPVSITKGGPLGLYFAWGAFAKVDGEDFVDAHGDVIPEDDLVAAAVTLAEAGTLKLEHSGGARGEVPLVMPLTTDIAKALGIETRNSGLVVGFRPDAELAKSIDSGEIVELSIAGRALAELAKAAIAKSEDGAIAKAAHKRTLRSLEIDEISLVKRAAHGAGTRIAIAKRAQPEERPMTDIAKRAPALTDPTAGHQHAIYDVEESDGGTSYEVAPGSEYGHSHPWVRLPDGSISIGEAAGHTHTVTTAEQATMADDIAKNLQAAQADIAKARKLVDDVLGLSPEQFAYAKRLGANVAAYVAKTDAERDALAKPIHVAKSGEVFYSSDDPRLVSMAKAHDAMAVEVEKARDAASLAEIAKAADKLPGLKGAGLIVKAIHGRALTAEERAEALAALDAHNASLMTVTKSVGSGAEPGNAGALAAFESGLTAFAKAAGKSPDDVADQFMGTPEGARLYAAYEDERGLRPRA